MNKHWSDGLEPIDEEKCKWESATIVMIDEFTDEELNSPNFKELLKEKIKVLKKNFQECKNI